MVNVIKYILTLMLGVGLGYLFFADYNLSLSDGGGATGEIVTCSMHPQIKQDHPGICPICGMDLTPIGSDAGESIDPDAVMFSQEAVALAGIETAMVTTGDTDIEVRLYGKIQPNQRTQQIQSAYVAGRLEKLYINAVGDRVTKGQTLAEIYSPELYALSQEYCAALNYPAGAQREALVAAAEEKLRLLNITEEQISEIKASSKPSPYALLKANTSGTVIHLAVAQGNYVQQGQSLITVADLSRVWAVFEAYERDLPFLHVGDELEFTGDAFAGESFRSRITYIDPILNGTSRTAGVRLEIANTGNRFKPEMLVVGNASVSMKQYAEDVIVPASAVMWTGKRSVVYVRDESEEMPTFVQRQVTLGPALAGSYVITDGLAEGEEIAVNGTFVIDASAQLQGRKSMMTVDE